MAIDTRDFDEFAVEEKLHVAINVKDFKAIILHADSLKAELITARYTRPCRPLQLSYEVDGITCEFTLMTRGEAGDPTASAFNSSSSNNNHNTRELSARPFSRPTQTVSQEAASSTANRKRPREDTALPLPQQPASTAHRQMGEEFVPPKPSGPIDHDSLFVPADDDQQWDEPNYGDEDDGRVGWDANMGQVC